MELKTMMTRTVKTTSPRLRALNWLRWQSVPASFWPVALAIHRRSSTPLLNRQ